MSESQYDAEDMNQFYEQQERRRAQSFNRLAHPEEWSPEGLKIQHPLVTRETLQGQHPIREWEYSQALRALEFAGWDFQETRNLLFADVGGAGSDFWRTLTHYTCKPITRIDPNHDWSNGDEAAQYFRETLSQYLDAPIHLPTGERRRHEFDAVFCLSVIEHVPGKELQQFERDLVSLVRPGGLLVLTCDVGEKHPDTYHFHWMRERIYTPGGLTALHVVASGSYGLRPLTTPKYQWEGPTVYDYGVASLVFIKER